MKINSKRQERNYIIVALCTVLVIMGVGYAAFSQMLTINGTANISNSWCVGFDNTKTNTYTPKAGITGATAPTGSMTYSGTACESTLQPASSLTAHFYQPGDEIEYTLTIVNKSSVTAAIKSILVDNESVTSNTTKTKNNITYIVNMPEDTVLAPNASTTMKVIARFQNETDVTGNVNGQTETIEVKINTEQDDGTGGMDINDSKFTGTIYRNSSNKVYNNLNFKTYVLASDTMGMGPSDVFETEEECLAKYPNQGTYYCQTVENAFGTYTTNASTLNKTYYLKHDVEDDTIIASYICFVTDTEHCMKGGDSSFYLTNVGTLQLQESWFNSHNGGCNLNSSGSDSFCVGGGFDSVKALSEGYVHVYVGDMRSYCRVEDDGRSYCSE